MGITNRSTSELVLLIFAVTIGVTLLCIGVGVVVVELLHPEVDTAAVTSSLGQIIAVMVGVIVGYLAGNNRRQP